LTEYGVQNVEVNSDRAAELAEDVRDILECIKDTVIVVKSNVKLMEKSLGVDSNAVLNPERPEPLRDWLTELETCVYICALRRTLTY
jgi:hypothetical protein